MGAIMAQTWAKKFYASAAWLNLRDQVLQRDCFLCVRCGNPGSIVHHKVYLTAQNISDPYIALNADNLETLCKPCHDIEHLGQLPTDAGLCFDSSGNLVKKGEQWMS